MDQHWIPFLNELTVRGHRFHPRVPGAPSPTPTSTGGSHPSAARHPTAPPCRCPSPSPQAWTPSASSRTLPMWLPGTTRGCPATALLPRTLPSSAAPSGGHCSWTPSCRAASGSRTNLGRTCRSSAWASEGGPGAVGWAQARAAPAPLSLPLKGAESGQSRPPSDSGHPRAEALVVYLTPPKALWGPGLAECNRVLIGHSGWKALREPPTAAQAPHSAQACHTPPLSPLRYLDIIAQAVSEGQTLLIEDIGETVEAVLDPLLSRTTAKGRSAHPNAEGLHLPQAATAAPKCW